MKIKIMRIVMFGLILFFYGCSNKVESYNIKIVRNLSTITSLEVEARGESQEEKRDEKPEIENGDKKKLENNQSKTNNKSDTEERIEKLIPLIEKMIEKKQKEVSKQSPLTVMTFIDVQRIPKKVTKISFDIIRQELLYKLLLSVITLSLLDKKIKSIVKEIRVIKSKSIKVKIPLQEILKKKGICLQIDEKENKMLEYEVLDEFNLEKIRNLKTDKKVCIVIKVLLIYTTSVLILYTILEDLTLK